ncbi:hypothetical protein GOV11_05130 [Candidatus Woesearchaeota archaeon]|nr:hypothetical protein [Candidatus Woesearchaeota archaeon]
MAQTEDMIFGIADVIAAHNLLRYAREGEDEPQTRMLIGATMASLGYLYGPDIKNKFSEKTEIMEKLRSRAIYAGGGAMLGGIVGYLSGPDLAGKDTSKVERPSGLMAIASVGWLGYSLVGREETDHERQLWGLGAGSIGYLYGPELLSKIKHVSIPDHVCEDGVDIQARGAAIFGAMVGAGIGWWAGEEK